MAKRTKVLTKPTATARTGSDALTEVTAALVRVLPEPDDYLTGQRRTEVCLPNNILCFHRHSAFRLVEPGGTSSPRQHHRCILLISLGGTGRVHIDDHSVLLATGEAVLILPFQFHSYGGITSEKRCWLFITFEQADWKELAAWRSALQVKLNDDDLMLLRSFLQVYRSDERNLLALTLGLLLGRLAQRLHQKAPPETQGDDLLRSVNAQMLANLDQPISVKQLAAFLGLSASRLRTKFRELVGHSLGRHLRTLRVQRACSFLYSTDEAISTIADHCGFSSIYSFSRTFKNEMGVSPRTYREERRSDAPA